MEKNRFEACYSFGIKYVGQILGVVDVRSEYIEY